MGDALKPEGISRSAEFCSHHVQAPDVLIFLNTVNGPVGIVLFADLQSRRERFEIRRSPQPPLEIRPVQQFRYKPILKIFHHKLVIH